MSISLINGVLSPNWNAGKNRNIKKAVEVLVLKIALNALKAYQETRYTEFDALIKNWGCQITALEITELVQDPLLGLEVENTLPRVKSCLQDEEFKTLLVDPRVIRLTRLHLLKMVNFSVEDHGEEKPVTDVRNLTALTTLGKNFLMQLVKSIQIDESVQAAFYIELKAAAIPLTVQRASLLQRVISPNERRNSRGIVSHSSLHNTEVVFRVYQGIVLLKNKTLMCGKPIPDAKLMKLYIRMPEEHVMHDKEIEQLPEATPLIVIEGYVKVPSIVELAEWLQEEGLIELLNADNGVIRINKEPLPNDPEGKEDFAFYSQKTKLLDEIFQPDHLFASSLKVEK